MEGIDQIQDKYVVILGSAPSEMHLLNPTLPEALRADSFKKKPNSIEKVTAFTCYV